MARLSDKDQVWMRAFPVQATAAAGMYVYNPDEWEAKGVLGSELADKDLKAVLEGLAKHLFGDVEVCFTLHLPNLARFTLLCQMW